MPTAIKEITTKQLNKAELSAIYDRIYNIADRLFKKYNPCNIHTECGKTHCLDYRGNRSYDTSRLCCSGCGEFPETNKGHWSKTGCTTKCLACKLYLCAAAQRQERKLTHQLYRLRKFATKYGLPASTHYFVSKEKWLKVR